MQTMICENEKCKKEHDGSYASGRFCTKDCAKSFSTSKNREIVNQKISAKLSKRFYLCQICGESSSRARGGTVTYCSIHKKKPLKDRTLDELKKLSSKKIRLIKEYGYKCWSCGLSEWCGDKIPLQIDHIDGNIENNTRENLRILCANCHAQTDTFCGKNIGKNKIVRSRKRI